MLNKREQNAICVCSLVEGFMMVVEENGSKSAAKLAKAVKNHSDAVIMLHPQADTVKLVKSMQKRIKRFERDVLHKESHTAISLTAALMAMIDTVRHQLDDKRAELWNKMHVSLFSLHKYYDRKLDNNHEYAKGSEMAHKWECYV